MFLVSKLWRWSDPFARALQFPADCRVPAEDQSGYCRRGWSVVAEAGKGKAATGESTGEFVVSVCVRVRVGLRVLYAFFLSKNEIIGLSENHKVVDSDDLAKWQNCIKENDSRKQLLPSSAVGSKFISQLRKSSETLSASAGFLVLSNFDPVVFASKISFKIAW